MLGFRAEHPGISFDVHTGNADLIKERLDSGLTDIGLLLEPIDMDRYDFVRLQTKERWGAVMRSSHTLASEPFIEPEMLKRYPVTLPARLKVRNELASWLGDDIDGLNVIAYSNLSTNALTIAEKTDALVLCVEGSKPYLDHDQMVFVPLKPELTAASVIAWKKNYPFSKAVSRFIEYIRYTVNQ